MYILILLLVYIFCIVQVRTEYNSYYSKDEEKNKTNLFKSFCLSCWLPQ